MHQPLVSATCANHRHLRIGPTALDRAATRANHGHLRIGPIRCTNRWCPQPALTTGIFGSDLLLQTGRARWVTTVTSHKYHPSISHQSVSALPHYVSNNHVRSFLLRVGLPVAVAKRHTAVLCWDPLLQDPRPAQTTGILGSDQYVAPTAGVRNPR